MTALRVRVIAGGHILDPRGRCRSRARTGSRGNTRRAPRGPARCSTAGLQARLHGDVDAARERARMRHEIEFRLDAGRELRAGGDLRHVPVARAPRSCTDRRGAADGAWTRSVCRPEPVLPVMPATNNRVSVNSSASSGTLASSVAVAKQPGCAHVRRRRGRQMFRDRTGELADARRCAMGVFVHRLIGSGIRVAKVRRDVDAMRARAAGLGRGEQPVDESGGGPCGAAQNKRGVRRAPDQRLDLLEARQNSVPDRRCANAETQRQPARPVGCRTKRRQFRAAGAPRSAAIARRPHSRCPRARSPACGRSRPLLNGAPAAHAPAALASPTLRKLRREIR